jgi:hypothetical protein
MPKYEGPADSRSPEQRAEQNRINGAKATEVNKRSVDVYPKSEPIYLETSLADLEADIYDPRAKVDPEMKIHAAMCFMSTGTVKDCARLTGLDHRLISEWKNKSQWWPTVIEKLRKEKQEELDAAFTEVIHDAAGALKDRIQNGEEVVTKDGIIKKKLGGRDLSTILANLYDKRAALRGDPSSITRRETATDVMDQLRSEFTEIAKQALDKKVVSDQ